MADGRQYLVVRIDGKSLAALPDGRIICEKSDGEGQETYNLTKSKRRLFSEYWQRKMLQDMYELEEWET
jgi:hypothetical protein